MSRNFPFEINDLLDGMWVRTAVRGTAGNYCSLWMNFHGVYPEVCRVC